MNTEKSPEAFRTISEVADWLGTPAHVLRFWESRFPQIKPVKRAGGRRYYRPADMELLGGIKKLLHDDGMTIRGVQKLLRENGVRRVADLSPPLAPDLADALSRDREQTAAQAPSRPAPSIAVSAPRGDPLGPIAPPAGQPAPAELTDWAPPAVRDSRADWPPADTGPDAPMAEDMDPGDPEPAEVLPFVLSARARADAAPATSPGPAAPALRADTPDLFDRPDLFSRPAPPETRQMPEPEPAPPEPAAPVPRLRMPAIPPDPTDSDPLPAHGPRRPTLPRRPSHRPDDRLSQLFHRLADLRGRMDRPES